MNPANGKLPAPEGDRPPALDEVSVCARVLWEEKGRPPGRDLEIWLEAKRQVAGASPRAAESPRRSQAATD